MAADAPTLVTASSPAPSAALARVLANSFMLSSFSKSLPACQPRSGCIRSPEWTGLTSTEPRNKRRDCSRGVAGVDVLRCLLLALRRHLRGIRRAGNAARSELLALDVLFGEG